MAKDNGAGDGKGGKVQSLEEAKRSREEAKAKGNGKARNGDNAVPATEANSYFDNDDGIWRRHYKPSGDEETPERLTNFTARIIEQRAIDDGGELRQTYVIAAGFEGHPNQFDVPAGEFNLMDWVVKHLPIKAGVLPGRSTREHTAWAIRQLSGATKHTIKYAHHGWPNPTAVAAVGGVAAGANHKEVKMEFTVELPPALERSIIPEAPTDPREDIRTALQMLDLAADEIMAPVFAGIYRSVLGECNFSLFIVGATGSFKTELAALAMGHFGKGYDADHLPCDWTWTENALEYLAFVAKDGVLVIDDFRPGGDSRDHDALMRKADRLFRAAGNRQGRGRMTAELKMRTTYYPRCLIIATGETYPRGQSLAGRVLFVELAKGDIEEAWLTACQIYRDKGYYVSAMAAYIEWLAPQLHEVQAQVKEVAANVAAEVRSGGGSARTPGIVGELLAGAACFLWMAVERGAISANQADEYEARVRQGLLKVGRAQGEHQREQAPAWRFLALLNSALVSGRAHLKNREDGEPENAKRWGWHENSAGILEAKGPCVGWLDKEGIYLNREASYQAAQSAAVGDSRVEVGERTLWKRLHEAHLLAIVDDTRETLYVRRTICGESQTVVVLVKDAFVREPENHGDKPDNPELDPKPGRPTIQWRQYRGLIPDNPTNGKTNVYLSERYK